MSNNIASNITTSSDDYVTVVAVEETATATECKPKESEITVTASQFVTVLSISAAAVDTEVVNVHRRTNERLGFGLKFHGGTKNNEKVEKLYIQSCAVDSPASRARATWGELKEGDEILEINGVMVSTLSRIQCVQQLKDGSDPLKLLIRDGKGKDQQTQKRHAPPPPPPVPPRKISKQKLPIVKVISTNAEPQELTPPPEAEFYLNLFDQNERKASESDGDSASTLSTVIDKFSLCSSMSMSSISESEYEANVLNGNNPELAKVLKPFQLLEKEFQLETTTKIEIVKPTEIKVISYPDTVQKHNKTEEPKDYENVDMKSVTTARRTVYENIEMRPTPKPRQTLPPKVPLPRTREFSTIQTWLADATELIHECPVAVKNQTTINERIFPSDENDVSNFDSLDVEEGEKLGPPELLALPGPSEVYFNFSWPATTLSTIGEEGEESSLDLANSPIVVINSADDDYDDDHNDQVNVTCPQHESAVTDVVDVLLDVKSGNSSSTTNSETLVLFTNNNNDNNNHNINESIGDDDKNSTNNNNLIDDNKSKSMETEETTTESDACSNENDKSSDKSSMLSMVESVVVNSAAATTTTTTSTSTTLVNYHKPTNNLVLNVVLSCEKKVEDGGYETNNNNMSQMSVDEEVQEQQKSHIEFEERIILGIEHNTGTKSNDEVEHCQQDKEIGKQEAAEEEDITRTAKFGAMIPSSMLINDLPPAFSRLPPDGHEFPPNFIEPIILSQVDADMLCKHSNTPAISDKIVNGYNNNSDKIPELPKTVPPPVPRKSRASNEMLIMKSEQRGGSDKENNSYASIRNSFNNLTVTNGNGSGKFDDISPRVDKRASNWRKDEKSEKSVRDKIAMFSSSHNNGDSESPKLSSHLAKSTECLDTPNNSKTLSRKYSEDFSRTRSVESLDEVDRGLLPKPERTTYEAAYHSKFMVEKSKPVPVLEKAFSVESLSNDIIPPPASYSTLPRKSPNLIVSRRTSFSGTAPEERKANVNTLLEQRKRSMSKLRGLVIPEKVPESDVLPHMPIIKSKDCEKINAELLPKLEIRSLAAYARRASVDSIPTVQSQQSKPYVPSSYRAMLNAVHGKPSPPSTPPAKPPRTALPAAPRQHENYRTDESEDSDSLMSRRSSPPVSPAEKLPLTRTLSSETNVSVTSSNSTLTSGSGSAGSQASCSSVGSTPTVDMSRKISKSSSEQSVNRKNILALSKSRNGDKKYDGDSTEEEDTRRPSSKTLTNYKLLEPADIIESKVINIAQYVEVIDEDEQLGKPQPPPKDVKLVPKVVITERRTDEPSPSMTDLAKWVRSEAAKTITTITTSKREDEDTTNSYTKKFMVRKEEKIQEKCEEKPKRESRFAEPKKLNLQEIRKTFEVKATSPPVPIFKVSTSPTTAAKEKISNGHDRFSSWDSVASSSSGVSSMQTSSLINGTVSGSSQNLQSPPSEFGSFSSLGSSHSLITPQDLQLLVEEADPPLQTPDAFVIVLQRDTPESSIGITLAGGSDYETKEITIHKILTNSPADKDGRLKKGDRILSINGLSMRGLTHRESLTVLKTPRSEVVLVVTRSKSLPQSLNKSKLGSLGSLCSLADKSDCGEYVERKISKNKGCRSLDLDLELMSNEDASISISTSEDGQMSNDEAFSPINCVEPPVAPQGHKIVELMKDGGGLGFSIEGGFDSPNGDRPLQIKKIFMGGIAEKSGKVSAGDEIISINEHSVERMTRIEVWTMMKRLPNGPVRILLK